MKYTIVTLLLFFLALTAYAQDTVYAGEIIKTLSSEKFKGRGYTGNGNKQSADFIADEYRKLKLNSFTENYFQPFTINVNTFPGNMKCVINERVLKPGEEYLIDPASCPIKGEFQAITVSEKDLLSETVLRETVKKASGKILFIDGRDFVAEDKTVQKKVSAIINAFQYDPEISNAATILLTHEKLTWGISTVQAKKPSLTIKGDFNAGEISSIKLDIEAKMKEIETGNIVGYIKGKQQPDTFLVVMAHYDHLGQMGSETIFPGANDNASGVAMLLSLARHFANSDPKYSMVFIALGAEETGLQGADYFVSNPLIDLKKIRFLINFDLAGTGQDGIKVVNGSVFKDQFDLLQKINSDKNYLKTVAVRGAACNSDHCLFYQKGVPCFYIYTLGGIAAYHDIYDRAETLPLIEFNNYTRLMIDFLGAL